MPGIDALKAAPLNAEPFAHAVVPGFLTPETVAGAIADFPKLDMAGLFLPDELTYGPRFAELLKLVQGDEFRKAVGDKLGVDLTGLCTLTTVRGCAQGKDGRIHADSKFKVATILLYLNEPWESQGGRLRVLRSGDNLDDYAGEVPPEGGTLFCFKVGPNSWHGHKPHVGVRRYIMLNYCRDEAARDSEKARHRLSGRIKKLKRVFGIGKIPVATAH
jgi:hypothetical protein